MSERSKIIAANIKKYREMRNMTQAGMAEKLKVDLQYYYQLEHGSRNFTLEKVIDSCDILGVEISDVVILKKKLNSENDKLNDIISRLKYASPDQLQAVLAFMDTIFPYIKEGEQQ
ncbi:MAG: helix-turn-helix domain-containing protein [Lachnospiraceae bacterium]|nr:helix-turn-helix domain-containing protein [Lachnospiraceae bacterium]